MTLLEPPRRRSRWKLLSGLFLEARKLERRRRRRIVAVMLSLCAAAGGGGLLVGGQGVGSHGGEARAAVPLVSSLALPRAGDFLAVGTAGNRVIVSGGPEGSLLPSGSTTSLVNGRALGICDASSLSPGTLRAAPVRHANCGDPALYGERVLAVSSLLSHRVRHGTGEFGIRIARVDPAARDGYTLGPVVMTYLQCSDCSAQWIYGDGSLWLYGHGELLRVSTTTGRVAERWAIPANPRELLAVDADGLWFAPSVEGGYPLHTTPAQLVRYRSLYRVRPGQPRPERVFTIPNADAVWLVAAGHTVWLESRGHNGRAPLQLWRLKGLNDKATALGHYPAKSSQGFDIGEAPPTHAGDAGLGIYFVNDPAPWSPGVSRQQVIHLSATAATERVIARIVPRTEIETYGQDPPAVILGGAFYFLDPAILNYRADKPPLIQGRGVLYRITTGSNVPSARGS